MTPPLLSHSRSLPRLSLTLLSPLICIWVSDEDFFLTCAHLIEARKTTFFRPLPAAILSRAAEYSLKRPQDKMRRAY